jgi:hypothetical protein
LKNRSIGCSRGFVEGQAGTDAMFAQLSIKKISLLSEEKFLPRERYPFVRVLGVRYEKYF